MSKPVLYESPEDARFAMSSALSVEQSAAPSVRIDTADLPGQEGDAEERARANVQSALERIQQDWGESDGFGAEA
jgi:hypothetical protein